ncbi:MAG: hypothetical protein IJ379_02565 [Lachnospiraceae bacterium]|nr:hypothetical protein [Lachnospiraceae bacterium]
MILKLKKCIKLMKYSYGLKANLFGAVLIFLLAFLGITAGIEIGMIGFMMSGLLFFLAFMMLIQLKDNLVFSCMVLASGKKRFLEVNYTDIYSTISVLGSYLLQSVLILVFVEDEAAESAGITIADIFIVTSICMAVFTLFYILHNKFFFLSILLSAFSYMLIEVLSTIFLEHSVSAWINHNKALGFLTGLGILGISIIISMIFRRIFYKKPVSPYSGSAGLRKAMQ